MLLLFSCRSQKPLTEVGRSSTEINESYLPEAVFSIGHSFETLKVKKVNVGFMMNGIGDTFNGSMAVYRDSLIVISVIPLLGYEALRIMCTRDSIIVINRPERTYHASSLDYYLGKYNIPAGFDDLQAVLINEVFIYRAGFEGIKYEQSIEMENGDIVFIVKALLGSIILANQEFAADSASAQIRKATVIDYQRGVKMAVKYADFDSLEKDSFPNNILIDIKDRRNEISLSIDYGQVIFDDRINVNFEIPDSYSRIYM